MQHTHILIIGAGMAGTRFAMQYAKSRLSAHSGLGIDSQGEQSQDEFAITLINSEPYAGYNRIMLSPVLAGEKRFAEIYLFSQEEYANHNITVKTGCTVSDINLAAHQVITDSGETIGYDKLVFATGSTPFILPLPNHSAKGVMGFRTKADVDAMLDIAKNNHNGKKSPKCLVIGGGLLGLEAANALVQQGAKVTVVHGAGYLLNRQLDKTAADLLQTYFENKGIEFVLNANSQAICVDEDNQVTGLTYTDNVDTSIPAKTIDSDCIIMTVGVRPNIALAQQVGITCERGILVDNQMRTHTPDVYAIGECVQFDNQLFGLVAPVYEQANILLHTLNEQPDSTSPVFSIQPTATKLKVSGVALFSAGDIDVSHDCEQLIYQDPSHSIYQKITVKDNRILSAVLYGDVQEGSWFFELIQNQQDISAIKDKLLFGKAFCEELLAG